MSRLTIRREAGGERHYIGDVDIHAGDFIRAFVEGEWRDGRYEASWSGGKIVGAWFYYGDNSTAKLTDTTPVEEYRR